MDRHNKLEFSLLVLCGGKSSRMGSDKALLELEGETLLDRTVRLGQRLGAAQLLISRNAPGFIQDLVQNAGPMAGIAAALPHCQSRWLLVLPVDMPLLCPQALAPLLQQVSLQQQACFFEGFPLPVLLEHNCALQLTLADRLTDPQASRSLQLLWQQLGYTQLPMTRPELFCNTNDPASFAAIATQCVTDSDHRIPR